MVCRDRTSLSRQSPIVPTRARSVVRGSLSHACPVRILVSRLSCARLPALVRTCCVVLSRYNFCVTTQSLPALTTLCHDSPLSHLPAHIRSCADPCYAPVLRTTAHAGAHPLCRLIATQGLLALTTLYRDTGSKGLCRDRENLCRNPSHPVLVPNPNLVATQG